MKGRAAVRPLGVCCLALLLLLCAVPGLPMAEQLESAADRLAAEVRTAISQGSWERAVRAARRLAELEPQQASSHFLLGLGLQRSGRPAEALAPLERAVQLEPLNPDYQ